MTNELQAFLRSRRSIRFFKTESVPDETIRRILDTAICAPSAHNLQPCRFVILTGIEAKSHLAEAIVGKFRKDMITDGIPEDDIQVRVVKTVRRVMEAPVIIVLCRERTKVKSQPDVVRQQAEVLLCIQSVALAGLQLLLAAKAEGLGGTWICWPLFAPEETCLALGLVSDWEPQGMIFLGYPAEAPEMPARLPLHEVTRYL
jgi:coenzyme F420-0:L-glutamate ligase / coenzyme F420-1:gamma-L-glutamate ligase